MDEDFVILAIVFGSPEDTVAKLSTDFTASAEDVVQLTTDFTTADEDIVILNGTFDINTQMFILADDQGNVILSDDKQNTIKT